MRPVVLVVDDEEDIRWLVGEILETAGYDIARACDGADALERLTAGLRPDAVVLDLMMPRMNGWELARAMRADPAFTTIPVVLISGNGRVAEDARELGAAGYLPKPFDMHELIGLVQRCVPAPG